MKSEKPCTICGEKEFWTEYSSGAESRKMAELDCCYNCAYWEVQRAKKHLTVIDGRIYGPGNRTSGSFRGMAGRRFDIEYFDGEPKRITTFDLWAGGQIPDRLRDQIPDTARFLHGAEQAQAGEITCWNPSGGNTPPYPPPSARGLK